MNDWTHAFRLVPFHFLNPLLCSMMKNFSYQVLNLENCILFVGSLGDQASCIMVTIRRFSFESLQFDFALFVLSFYIILQGLKFCADKLENFSWTIVQTLDSLVLLMGSEQ
jgi:hypothetical protein